MARSASGTAGGVYRNKPTSVSKEEGLPDNFGLAPGVNLHSAMQCMESPEYLR